MYNGIGLVTPRGSGTNGYVQRNIAQVRHRKEKTDYKTEEDIRKMELSTIRKPNQEILDHERKRKMELRCMEMEELMKEQGYSDDDIESKVSAFRRALMEEAVDAEKEIAKDENGRIIVKETHQLAEANQEKNSRLREAFGINQFYVDGSSLDPNRKVKEAAMAAAAITLAQKKYALIRDSDSGAEGGASPERPPAKKKSKKKKRSASVRDRSESPETGKRDKKKKSKKRKRDRSESPSVRKQKKNKKQKKSNSSPPKEKRRKRADNSSSSDSDSEKSSSDSDVVSRKRKRDSSPPPRGGKKSGAVPDEATAEGYKRDGRDREATGGHREERGRRGRADW